MIVFSFQQLESYQHCSVRKEKGMLIFLDESSRKSKTVVDQPIGILLGIAIKEEEELSQIVSDVFSLKVNHFGAEIPEKRWRLKVQNYSRIGCSNLKRKERRPQTLRLHPTYSTPLSSRN